MKVFIVFLCAFAVYIAIQCKGSVINTSTEGSGIAALLADSGWYCNCIEAANTEVHGAVQAVEYCEHVNMTTLSVVEMLDRQCFNDATYIVCCLVVLSALTILVPMWKILRKPTKKVKTKLQTKLELVKKLDHLRAILNAIGVGVICTDSQTKIRFINATAARMCGWCPQLAIGKPICDVVRFKNKSNEISPCNLLRNLKVKHSISEDFALELHSCEGRYLDVQQKVSPLPINGEAAGAVTLLLDVTASREVIRKLSYSASHDPLTGLPNRATFEKYLRRAVISSEDWSMRHALVFIDLDGFKMINDSGGHAAGDELLKQIAKLMQLQLRHSDFVGRLGGDEFGLILFNCELSQAKALINLLVSLISEHSFWWEGAVKRVGASAGITSLDSSKKDIGKLLAEADAACYAAKRRGKRQVCVFEEYTEKSLF